LTKSSGVAPGSRCREFKATDARSCLCILKQHLRLCGAMPLWFCAMGLPSGSRKAHLAKCVRPRSGPLKEVAVRLFIAAAAAVLALLTTPALAGSPAAERPVVLAQYSGKFDVGPSYRTRERHWDDERDWRRQRDGRRERWTRERERRHNWGGHRAWGGGCRTVTIERDDGSIRRIRRCD
jgi:Ni/Co efflux regulator RcnB